MQNTSGNTGESFRRLINFPAASRLIGLLLAQDEEVVSEQLPAIPGYELKRQLGEGGGGEVYLAFRSNETESLAIKLMRKTSGNRKTEARAWRELDILSDLNLDGVPPIRDYGMAQGRFYIVTAHIEGLTLDDHCRQRNLDRKARVELLAQIADVVQKLHEHGVMHRDIKPDNIIIRRDGRAVIIDFGIASLFRQEADGSITTPGAPIGTIGFMSPEQAQGETAKFSTRTDVYGLGATACLILTGKTPHDVDTAWHEAVRRTAQDPPRNPLVLDPNLPTPLAQIIARATAQHPEDRYPVASLLADDLRRWLRDEPILWQKTPWLTRLYLAWRRNRRACLAKAAMWIMALTVFVTSTLAIAQHRVAADERANAHEAALLRDQAQATAAQQTALVERESGFKVQYQQQVAQLEIRQKQLEDRERRLQDRRQKQIELVKLAGSQGELFQASIILLGLGEDLESEGMQDKEMVAHFVSLLHELIDRAKAQHSKEK